MAQDKNLRILTGPLKCTAFSGEREISMMYYTYVLHCYSKNKLSLYVGSCKDLKVRIKEHLNRNVKTTKKFDRVKLIYYESCLSKTDAIKREIQLKTGFGRGYIKRRLSGYLKLRV